MKVLIAGGGTGGHLFPGIAVAEELAARGHEPLFVGTARGIEVKAVPKAGYRLELIDVVGLKRRGLGERLKGVLALPRAFAEALALLRRERPDVVIGVGGYASGPVVLVAAIGGYRTAILEQNSVPGFTNRTLGRFVDRVFGAFASARDRFPARKYALVGNPVRRQVREALQRSDGPGELLLIVGGSQGAHAVNELVFAALAQHYPAARAPRVLHQTGAADCEALRRRYEEAGIAAEVHAFIDDMGAAYRRAALVVARAGASTIAELTLIGRPAIFIPFPAAADDHQTINARELVEVGAAELMPQATATAASLAAAIRRLLENDKMRQEMAERARAAGFPGAHVAIADAVEALVA